VDYQMQNRNPKYANLAKESNKAAQVSPVTAEAFLGGFHAGSLSSSALMQQGSSETLPLVES